MHFEILTKVLTNMSVMVIVLLIAHNHTAFIKVLHYVVNSKTIGVVYNSHYRNDFDSVNFDFQD